MSRFKSISNFFPFFLIFAPFKSFITTDESFDVVVNVVVRLDTFVARTRVAGLLVRTFFDGDAESSLESLRLVSRLREFFVFGDIFSAFEAVDAFGAFAVFAAGRLAFGILAGLGAAAAAADFLPVDVNADDSLNSSSPLLVLPSDLRPSRKILRHFS